MTICQTDSTLILICAIVSKWVLSLILQPCHKLYKICFLYTFYGPNEKVWNSQSLVFYSSLAILHSIRWWSFHINLSIYNNIFKYNQNLLSYYQQKYTREMICRNWNLFFNNAPTSYFENELWIFFKKM